MCGFLMGIQDDLQVCTSGLRRRKCRRSKLSYGAIQLCSELLETSAQAHPWLLNDDMQKFKRALQPIIWKIINHFTRDMSDIKSISESFSPLVDVGCKLNFHAHFENWKQSYCPRSIKNYNDNIAVGLIGTFPLQNKMHFLKYGCSPKCQMLNHLSDP